MFVFLIRAIIPRYFNLFNNFKDYSNTKYIQMYYFGWIKSSINEGRTCELLSVG